MEAGMKKVTMMAMGCAVATLLTAFPQFASADDKGDAVARVQKAVAMAKASGIEKALEVLNDEKSELGSGANYVFAYDMDGTMLANAVKKELIGKNTLDVPDAKGKKFRREMIEKMKTDGKGWIDYFTINPKTKENEEKSSYCEKIEDAFFCCGIYKK
jgi:signal transduction histidine kinase